MDLINKKRHPKYYKDISERRERLKKDSVSDLIGEVWVSLDGYDGYYMISNLFRIKSICRIVERGNNSSVMKPQQLIRPARNSDGYLCVILTKDKIPRTYSLHVLVAKAFVPNPFNYPEVNHKDGDKLNCLPGNLEWGTRKYNMQHAVANGLRKYKKGFKGQKFKLSQKEIAAIYNSKEKSSVLAVKYGLTKSSIQRIRSGKTYSKITNENKDIASAYHKLNNIQVEEIKKSHLSQRELCSKYEVSKGTIHNIKKGQYFNKRNLE